MIVVFGSSMSDESSVDLRVRVSDMQGRAMELNGSLDVYYDRYDDGRACLAIEPNTNYALGTVGTLRNTRDTVGIALTIASGREESIVVHIAILIQQDIVASEAITFIANPGSWESELSIRYR